MQLFFFLFWLIWPKKIWDIFKQFYAHINSNGTKIPLISRKYFQKSKWLPSSCEYFSPQSVWDSEGDGKGNFKIRFGGFYGQRRLQLSHDYKLLTFFFAMFVFWIKKNRSKTLFSLLNRSNEMYMMTFISGNV